MVGAAAPPLRDGDAVSAVTLLVPDKLGSPLAHSARLIAPMVGGASPGDTRAYSKAWSSDHLLNILPQRA